MRGACARCSRGPNASTTRPMASTACSNNCRERWPHVGDRKIKRNEAGHQRERKPDREHIQLRRGARHDSDGDVGDQQRGNHRQRDQQAGAEDLATPIHQHAQAQRDSSGSAAIGSAAKLSRQRRRSPAYGRRWTGKSGWRTARGTVPRTRSARCSADRRTPRSPGPSAARTSWPAISAAVSAMRMVKPMASPISSCWTAISTPAAEAGSTAGIGGSTGARSSVTKIANPTLAGSGTLAIAQYRLGEDQPEHAQKRPEERRDPGVPLL